MYESAKAISAVSLDAYWKIRNNTLHNLALSAAVYNISPPNVVSINTVPDISFLVFVCAVSR